MKTNQQSLFSFQADLEKFSKKIGVNLGTVVKKVVLTAHDKIVMRTPVDTGRARASWGIAQGTRPTAVPPPFNKAEKISKSAATAAAKAQQQKFQGTDPAKVAFGVFWIFNNLPYIVPLEYGHSKQAPAGMVRVSLAEVEMEIARYLK